VDPELVYHEFERLKRERWDLTEGLANNADDFDVMLADIANMALYLYMSRKVVPVAESILEGFVSNAKRKPSA